MATLTVEDITESGVDATYNAAAAAGDDFANDSSSRIFAHVKNGAGTSVTITCTPEETSKSVPGFGTMTKSGISVAIPAGEDRFIGPFPITAYGSTPLIEYSSETSVTVAILKV